MIIWSNILTERHLDTRSIYLAYPTQDSSEYADKKFREGNRDLIKKHGTNIAVTCTQISISLLFPSLKNYRTLTSYLE